MPRDTKNAPGSELPDDAQIELAAVVRAHALTGELVLKVFNPDSHLLGDLDAATLRLPSGEHRSIQVESVRGTGESMIVKLRGVDSRDAAEALRGSLLCVPRTALPPLEEGEYYLTDLPGLEVRDPSGQVLGHVEDVLEYPTVNALQIITDGVVREVPDLERYLLEVRVDDGYVVVDHLDELEPVPLAALKGKR